MKYYELPNGVLKDIDNKQVQSLSKIEVSEEEALLMLATVHIKKAYIALAEAQDIVTENETDQEFADKYALLIKDLLKVLNVENIDFVANASNLHQAIIIEAIIDNNTEKDNG
jgi:hypothetical protein